MKSKSVLAAALAVVIACVAVALVIIKHQGREAAPKKPAPEAGVAPRALLPVPEPLVTEQKIDTKPAPAESGDRTNAKPPAVTAPSRQLRRVKAPVQDPTARLALSFVGIDPDAEAYWIEAINDPGLPAEERKDMIEDLNEDGFSDPRHPGMQDIPLIVSRIRLIPELALDAMDQVNADAFEEAYKDLVNMLNGQPVQ
jgi:hypothetical protein